MTCDMEIWISFCFWKLTKYMASKVSQIYRYVRAMSKFRWTTCYCWTYLDALSDLGCYLYFRRMSEILDNFSEAEYVKDGQGWFWSWHVQICRNASDWVASNDLWMICGWCDYVFLAILRNAQSSLKVTNNALWHACPSSFIIV